MNNSINTTHQNESEQYYIVRCDRAGVFFGRILFRDGTEAGLADARRIWYWDGAASLSQLAIDGVSRPQNCKFSVVVPDMIVLGVIEIIPCTPKAVKSIMEVPVWKV